MTAVRVILTLVCLAGLASVITVEGELLSLDARLSKCELASGLRSPWAGAQP